MRACLAIGTRNRHGIGERREWESARTCDSSGHESGVKGYSIYCPTRPVDCVIHTLTDAEGNYAISGLHPELLFNYLSSAIDIPPHMSKK